MPTSEQALREALATFVMNFAARHWGAYPTRGSAESFLEGLAALSSPETGGGWRPIETAPRDGTVFVGCNLDHPSFGSWPMYRRVLHTLRDGNFVTLDRGGWMLLRDVEPDYEEGHDVGPAPEASIALDELNTSVRYGWRPLPSPESTSNREEG